MNTPEPLEQRVSALESVIQTIPELLAARADSMAEISALRSIAKELLAMRFGVTPDRFDNAFKIRTHYYKDKILQTFVDNPGIARRIDSRPLNAVRVDSYPPLFDPGA